MNNDFSIHIFLSDCNILSFNAWIWNICISEMYRESYSVVVYNFTYIGTCFDNRINKDVYER